MRSLLRAITLVAAVLLLPALLDAASPPAADIAAGERSYLKCGGCHSPERNRAGPRHCGLLGRVAGTVAGYEYSTAMRNSGITWSPDTLDRFLRSPLNFLPGTSMGFVGLQDPAERRNVIAWLGTLNARSALCPDNL